MMNTLQKLPKKMTSTSIQALNKGAKKTKATCTYVTASISHQATQGAKMTKHACSKVTTSISRQAVHLNRQMVSALTPKRRVGVLPSPEDETDEMLKEEEAEIIPQVKRDPLFVAYIKEVLEENDDMDNLISAMKTFFEDKHHLLVVQRSPSTGVAVTLEAFDMLYGHVILLEGGISAEIVEVAHHVFDAYICVRFDWFCVGTNLTTLTPKEIAMTLNWLTAYRAYWDAKYPGNAFPQERVTWIEQLKSEYLRRGVHDQVRTMIGNRLELLDQDEIIENEDGTLSTSIEYDITLIVEAQLSVARESLPATMLPSIMSACNEELLNLAGGIMFEIETKWKTTSVERLCSYVNDSQCLLDQFEQRNAALNANYEDDISCDNLLRECSLLSLHATRYLCERIFLDMREDVLETVGTNAWIEGQVIDTVVTTLRDYFEDIRQWVPADYFFPKILKTCVDLILRIYVESFFSNTMTNGLVSTRINAVNELQSDWEKLWRFFGSEHRDHHGCAGFYDKESLWHRLHILEIMSAILTTTSEPAELQDSIQVMFKQLGTDVGSVAILHLFGLQQRRISRWETQQWHETIALALEHAEMQLCAVEPCLYQISDLRNSRFVKRVGRGRHSNHLVNVSHTNKLVGGRGPSNLIVKSRKLFGSDCNLITSWRLDEELSK